jgi:hypothetical protein
MKIQFGPFVVDSEGIFIKNYYRVHADTLWDIRDFKGVEVWDRLIHLTEKDFVTPDNYDQLNTAFFFAQSYFTTKKPKNITEASTYQTLYIQKQMMEQKRLVLATPTLEDGLMAIYHRDEIKPLNVLNDN